MSEFYGADTERLRAHAQLMRERAGTIADLRSRLEPMVMDEGAWVGTDADSFRQRWQAEAAQRFQELGDTLTSRGEDLERQAEDQDRTSAEDGGPGGSASGSGSGGGGILAKLLEAAKVGMKSFKGASYVWKALAALRNPAQLAEKLSGIPGKILSKLSGIGKLAEAAPFLTKIGKVGAKYLPVLDVITGGWQMITSLQKGDTFHAVTGGMQSLGGMLITAGTICDATGVGAVVGVPLQIAGAVIGGAGMLADGVKWASDHWGEISHVASEAWNGATDMVGRAGSVVKDVVGGAVDGLRDMAGGALHAFGF